MKLSESLRLYEAHVRAKGLENNTVKNRIQPIRVGIDLWGDIPTDSLTSEHIDSLFAAHNYAARTQNLYIGGLRAFFDWASHSGMHSGPDPTYGWRSRKVVSQDRLRIPVERFPELLDAAEHPRDRMILAIGIYTFMRGGEIRTLRVNDVNFTDGSIRMYRHKTKEQDNLPICVELADELREYLSTYRKMHRGLEPTWYLVPAKNPDLWLRDQEKWVRSSEPSRMKPTTPITHPYRVAQRAIQKLGYPDVKNEGIHTLRRSGARALLEALRADGVDSALLRVGAMLGHKDTKVTAHYIGLNMEREERNKMLSGSRMFPDAKKPELRIVK